MSTMTANGSYHPFGDAADSPASPTSPSSSVAGHHKSLSAAGIAIRGQSSPFPSTPTSGIFSVSLDPPSGMSYAEHIRGWSDAHVGRWLTEIKCANQIAVFKANDIRGDIILELDQTTLQEMGVSSIGDRLRILNGVKSLRQRAVGRPMSSISSASSHRSSKLSVELTPTELASNLASKPAEPVPAVAPRAANRRLESGRPSPLQLSSNSGRSDLPRLVRDAQPPDSARSGISMASTSSNQTQHSVRPLPQPAQLSAAPSSSSTSAGTPSTTYSASSALSTGSRVNLPPLPPPPRGQPPLPPAARPTVRGASSAAASMTGRRTPTQNDSSASSGLLTPGSGSTWYGLPSDPRPGNPGGGKPLQSGGRSTSPLPPARPRNPPANPVHARNASLGVTSPGTSPGKSQRPVITGHPYANQNSLRPPGGGVVDLSPIQEHFGQSNGSSPSPPSYAGRTLQGNAPSLDDLRRKLVRFYLPEESKTFTIDVDTCTGGVEIIEKVLRKFGKGGPRSADTESEVKLDDEGLSVDGWSVYMDDALDDPLDEARLLSVCHAPLDHPARERPLILRRANRPSSPAHSQFLNPTSSSKRTKRASAVSILTDLGVRHPEQALEQQSPTSGSPANMKRPSKLRNFFGQRPPSELITNYLTEYFPNTEKKVLERTARHSMMLRSNTLSMSKRDSAASWIPPLPSRFSSSTQGSQSRTSLISTHMNDGLNSDGSNAAVGEDIPRVSLSTEDGQSVDLADNTSSSSEHPSTLPPIPFPSDPLSDSMENITGNLQTSRPVSRTMSNASRASRRMSYMTELRSKRDRSDTASLLTVDEITAEVESRQESSVNTAVDQGSDSEDWTKVGASETETDEETEATYNEVEEEEDVLDEDETTLNDGEEDEFGGKVKIRKANKWIKGALIGAGSFGKVYLGMDASTGLLMAVKQVELPTGSASNQERKKSMLTALEREIELLQDLQHENIVQYLYSSLEDDCLNIFLEYVPGGSVATLLRNYGAFEETLVKNFVRQILQGLNYLHERDIIHRDIKGANILVDNKGGVKISDFGISKKVDVQALAGNRAHRPSLQGSVFWMAPEVVKQSGHTFKADIWSVGCLVVEMLTGEHPWAQLTQMQAIFKIGSSAKPAIPTDISSDAQDCLTRTFELNHEARPSASDLLQHPFIAGK